MAHPVCRFREGKKPCLLWSPGEGWRGGGQMLDYHHHHLQIIIETLGRLNPYYHFFYSGPPQAQRWRQGDVLRGQTARFIPQRHAHTQHSPPSPVPLSSFFMSLSMYYPPLSPAIYLFSFSLPFFLSTQENPPVPPCHKPISQTFFSSNTATP